MVFPSRERTRLGASVESVLFLALLAPAAYGQPCAVPPRPTASACLPDIFSPGTMTSPDGFPTAPSPTAPAFAEGGQSIARGESAFEAGSPNMFGDTPLTGPTVTITLPGNGAGSSLSLNNNHNTAQTQLLIPTGGMVGRTKISDDNSPLPTDRVIFDYDYYNNVPLSSSGADVHRFSVGFEKTCLDGLMSLEVRVPFASTLNSDVTTSGLGSDRVELGDVHFTLKALLYGGPVVNVAAGLGIDVPTADDVRVFDSFGHEVLVVKNQSVILTPYIAYLVTPTDRCFFQNWVEFGFATNGNPVSANLTSSGLQSIGRLDDQDLCQIDAQLGYWLVRREDDSTLLSGLAPFVELHYNTTLGNAEQLQSSSSIIGAEAGHTDELNLSAGFMARIGDCLQLAVGAVVPLLGNDERTFDWQVGVHGSFLFGPAARDRSRAALVSGF